MQYRPQLDALRTLAVAPVLLSHFWLSDLMAAHLGVRLFFVLSGFLITGLLLERPPLGDFYLRRAARLLPAFFLALAVAFALNLDGLRATWPWHLLGGSNFLFAARGDFDAAWPAAHLWTLNVEQQFYLAWPLLVLWTPRRSLPHLILALMTVAWVFRSRVGGVAGDLLPPASFDALGAGALMALYRGPGKPVYLAGAACAPLLVLGMFVDTEWAEAGALPAMAALVLAGSRGVLPIAHPLLIGLGKISYGVYLYHVFVEAALIKFLHLPAPGPVMLVAGTLVTLPVAWLSYRLFEAPIRRRVGDLLAARRLAPVAASP